MRDREFCQCPLFEGLDAMRRAELLGILGSSNLRARLEKCMSGRVKSVEAQEGHPCFSAPSAGTGDFETVRAGSRAFRFFRVGAKE
jgi:hypothetical protein